MAPQGAPGRHSQGSAPARRGRLLALILGGVLALTSCTPGGETTSSGGCGAHGGPAPSGAPSSLGLTVGDASTPVWSSQVGVGTSFPVAAEGLLFTRAPLGCLAALDPRSGAVLWSWAVPQPSWLAGVTAGATVVVAALGDSRRGGGSTGGAATSYGVTDRLVAFDPSTGVERWSLKILDDGQGVPAVIAGNVVVVSQADGSTLGLDADTGRQLWQDPAPQGCPTVSGDPLNQTAVVLAGGPAVTVSYQCTQRDEIARLDPSTGKTRWTLALPKGFHVELQTPVGASSGVLGLTMSFVGLEPPGPEALGVPMGQQPPPGPKGYEAAYFLAVATDSGTPLWQLGSITAAPGVYGGSGNLCLVSGYGADCYVARTGALSWQSTPPVRPGQDYSFDSGGAVAASGRLYTVVPTAAAKKIRRGSTTYRSAPGTFRLHVMDMSTGEVLNDIPLPAFYGGPNGVVVSPDSPPGVIAVSGQLVFVSPQVRETRVIEAFALP